MEVIADELQKNGVHIDIETLSEHMNYILDNYKDAYNYAASRLDSTKLFDVFYQMSVNSVGRVMAYLTLT